MAASLEVQGLDALVRSLKGLPTKVRNKIVRQALRAAARPIKEHGQDNTPVESGELRSEWRIRAGKRKKGEISIEVRLNTTDAEGKFHGSFPEYGTEFQDGQHFVERTADATLPAASNQALKMIADGIEREAKA